MRRTCSDESDRYTRRDRATEETRTKSPSHPPLVPNQIATCNSKTTIEILTNPLVMAYGLIWARVGSVLVLRIRREVQVVQHTPRTERALLHALPQVHAERHALLINRGDPVDKKTSSVQLPIRKWK